MSKSNLIPPEFDTEAEERAFWEIHDSSDYLDWKQATPVSFPNLKPSTKTISLRLPETLLEHIKVEAHKRELKRSIIPLVCGVLGLVRRCSI